MCTLHIESCSIEVKTVMSTFIVIGIYRPHSGNVDGLILELESIFTRIPFFLRKKVILIGDFSINMFHEDTVPVQHLFPS